MGNRTSLPRDAFETIEVTIGAAKRPLTSMPCCKTEYQHRMGLHVGMMKMDQMKRDRAVAQKTIGGARREVVLVACDSAHIMITSSPASEYFGDHAYLAVKYAHLDIVILQMRDRASLKGLLPELWGFRPLSNRTKAMMEKPTEEATCRKGGETQCKEDVFIWSSSFV